MAALLALYGPHPRLLLTAAPELTMIILPLKLRKEANEAWIVWMREKKLTSNEDFQEPAEQGGSSLVLVSEGKISTGIAATIPMGSKTPALRTIASTRPKFSSAEATALSEVLLSVLASNALKYR